MVVWILDLFSHKHLVLVVKYYFENLGHEETMITVSLECPINKRRIKIPVRGDDCDHIKVQMMKLWQNLQVVPVYILSTIYLYRAQFIACVADGICWGLVGVCERGGGRGWSYISVAQIPRRKLARGAMRKTVCCVSICFPILQSIEPQNLIG